MPDPDLTPADNLKVYKLMSELGHATERLVKARDLPDDGFFSERLENGIVVACDEGVITLAHPLVGRVTLEAIDAAIEQLEEDIAGDGSDPA
jgi:hypothetical protein